jgi:hypothetical protein
VSSPLQAMFAFEKSIIPSWTHTPLPGKTKAGKQPLSVRSLTVLLVLKKKRTVRAVLGPFPGMVLSKVISRLVYGWSARLQPRRALFAQAFRDALKGKYRSSRQFKQEKRKQQQDVTAIAAATLYHQQAQPVQVRSDGVRNVEADMQEGHAPYCGMSQVQSRMISPQIENVGEAVQNRLGIVGKYAGHRRRFIA